MSQTDTNARSESGVDTTRAAAGSGREYVSKVAPYLRRGVESGAVTATVGGIGLLGGLRALLDGERTRGLARLIFGAAFLAVALAQRRSRGRGGRSNIDETDVVDTGPDVETVADEAGGNEEDHATGEAVTGAVDTSPDIEDVGSGADSDTDTDAESAPVGQRDVASTGADTEDQAETTERETEDTSDATEVEDVDRLGEAAFDSQSREVPAPQRAFNQGFLAHSTETYWGVRSGDDAVLVSGDYDAVRGRDGVKYVASSEIGDDVRELPIPDTILDHWDEVLGGGVAVTGGDDILFVTTDDLAADGLLRVLPAKWADDVFGEEE